MKVPRKLFTDKDFRQELEKLEGAEVVEATIKGKHIRLRLRRLDDGVVKVWIAPRSASDWRAVKNKVAQLRHWIEHRQEDQ